MIPFFIFRKTYTVNKTPYQLFNKINEETNNGSLTDIDVRFEGNDPPVYRLEIKKNQLGIRPKINAILWAKIEDAENGSSINIGLYSNTSIYIFLAVFLVSFVVNTIREEETMFLFLFSSIIFLVFVLIDLTARKEILKRFEAIISVY